MRKRNYISKVPEAARWTALAVLLPASLICTACFLLIITFVVIRYPNLPPLGPLLLSVFVLGAMTIASGWMFIRLVRNQLAENGYTVMPLKFIQIFGVVFLIGLCVSAIVLQNGLLLAEAAAIGIAMVRVRKLIPQDIGLAPASSRKSLGD